MTNETIESISDYDNKSEYWHDELNAAKDMLKSWHRQADKIAARYIAAKQEQTSQDTGPKGFRLNLFYSNVQVVFSLLYGRVPQVDVSRTYADSKDDVGRVAALILERLLNNDMADNPTEYDSVLRATLEDRLVPGLGVAKVRYEAKTEIQKQAAVISTDGTVLSAESEEEVVVSERCPADYFHWRDTLWSWCRTPADLRWMAFRTWITKDEATARYGERKAGQLEYKTHKMVVDEKSAPQEPDDDDYWMKAEIWEIWCRETMTVSDFSFGQKDILKTTPDPLNIPGFFPAPAFFIANATTSLYKPTPDFHMTQDLYNEIDKLQTRIARITEAVKVVGVYDAGQKEIGRMLDTQVDNKLIPVEKWAMFGEKGGLQGVVDWFPLQDVVAALLQLRQLRDETIELLYNITGMSDVMRGNLSNQYEGVGQTDSKVQFGSVRVQKLQEDFATFATNLMSIKADIIARKFDVETIIKLSNASQLAEDPELVAEAVALLKKPEDARLRVKIAAESLALMDYTKQQAERTEFLTGLAGFMQSAAPLIEQSPAVAPTLMKLLQWTMAGLRGADEAEGILDKAIEAAEKAEEEKKLQPPEPSPDMLKAQAALELEQAKQQGDMQAQQQKTEATMQIRQQDQEADIATKAAEHQMKLEEINASMNAELTVIRAKADADMAVEQQTSSVNAEQQALGVEAELNKDTVGHQQSMEQAEHQASLKLREIQEAKKESTDG